MDAIRRILRKSEATDAVLAAGDQEAEKVFGAPAARRERVSGDMLNVVWSAKLQQKLEADTSRIQSAQIVAKAINGNQMSVTGASHASVSLKQMLDDRKAKIAAAHDKFAASMGKLDQATTALDSLGDDVANEAADLMASIGQFKNNLDGSNG